MKIKNIAGFTAADLEKEISGGGRFVYFAYTISLLFVTFRDVSDVYLIRSGEGNTGKSLLFTLVTFLVGWWVFPGDQNLRCRRYVLICRGVKI